MAALKQTLDGRPTIAIAAALGVLGAVGVALGILLEPARALAAYLAAWCAVATTAVGALGFLAIGYAMSARWPAVVRRLCEIAAAGLLPIAVLGIPLVVASDHIWPWVDPPPQLVRAVAVKQAWLSVPWFVARTVLYLAVFVGAAELLRRWSLQRDGEAGRTLHRERRFASAMLPVLGLALTFAAFDWLMSLQPDWWSSAFGLYVLVGALLAGVAIITLLAWRGVAAGALPLTGGHFHALGRVLHAFVILWAYIAYFQAMLIQIVNKPSEAQFYVDRASDGWRVVTAVLVVLAFALPFTLLVPRQLKRRAGYVGAIAAMLLVAHYLDVWWLVIPHLRGTALPSWTDAAAICAIGGLTTAVCAWRARGLPLLAVGDPYLSDGLAYESTT